MRVCAFTGGEQVPSARLRVRQYIEPLAALGIEVTEYISRFGAYPPRSRLLRPEWAALSLLGRMPGIVASRRFDLTLLQREMLSSRFTLEGLTRAPRVLDVDDAIWLLGDGRCARRLASISQLVICGNAYLACMFGDWTRMVEVVPTAVDTERYKPSGGAPGSGRIVWVGTASNFHYLKSIERALAAVLGRDRERKLLVVSSERPHFEGIREEQVEFMSWSVSGEVAALQRSHVGIMPLDDGEWARGKCSYKMLTYLACGLPVVVSPVGMNCDVLALGRVGLAARNCDEWVEALEVLLRNPKEAAGMGKDGRRVAESFFSVGRVAVRLASVLEGVVE